MSSRTEIALTPRQRLARGLTYTVVGPLDVTRGVAGLGIHSATAGVQGVRRRYRAGRLAREVGAAQDALAGEFSAAQQVVAELPQALRAARQPRRYPRPWVIAAATTAAVLGGVAGLVVIRRATHAREQPSPRPPSVEVQPRP